jgi:DNA-binding transcriptional regulator YiaG
MANDTPVIDQRTRQSIGYVLRLADGRSVYLELPEEYISRDRSGQLLLRPPAVRHLDQIRAVAMRKITRPTPAYLITLRQTLDLTQEEFGEAVGVDKMTVSRWERGDRKPGVESLRRIEALRKKSVKHGVLLHD